MNNFFSFLAAMMLAYQPIRSIATLNMAAYSGAAAFLRISKVIDKNIQIKINKTGAELSSIVSLINNKEYLWRGDANFWGGQAPVLFPFVGRLKEDTFIENGKTYHQKQKHTFIIVNPL